MKIRPTKGNPRLRLVGLLHPGERGVEIETEMDLDASLFYVPYPVAKSFLVRGYGVGYGRRNRLNRYEFEPGKIAYVLPRNIESVVTLKDLIAVRDWVFDHGASLSSTQGTAMSLLCASLDSNMATADNGPPLQRIAGGRVHSAKHQMIPVVEQWDITAAFASTLAMFRPCGQWRIGRRLQDDGDQFVSCRIRVPYMAQWGPLPVVPKRASQRDNPIVFRVPYPQDKILRGIWTGDELRSAVAHGAKIDQVIRSYTLHASDRQPFAHWWQWLSAGRNLPGVPGRFLKAVSQSLWGIFAVSLGGAYREFWVDRRRHRQALPDGRYLLARRDLALADTLSARVRAKVYDEFIVPNSPNVLAVLTDGGLSAPSDPPDGNGWRLKDRGVECHFIDATTYRYISEETGELVCHAGAPTIEQNLERMALLERECFGRTELNIAPSPTQRLREAFPVSLISSTKYPSPDKVSNR